MTFFELRLHVYRSFLSVYLDPKVHCVLSLYERMLHARMADTLVKVSETIFGKMGKILFKKKCKNFHNVKDTILKV